MTSAELARMRAELLESKERLWAELNQAIGALALLDHLIESDPHPETLTPGPLPEGEGGERETGGDE